MNALSDAAVVLSARSPRSAALLPWLTDQTLPDRTFLDADSIDSRRGKQVEVAVDFKRHRASLAAVLAAARTRLKVSQGKVGRA